MPYVLQATRPSIHHGLTHKDGIVTQKDKNEDYNNS